MILNEILVLKIQFEFLWKIEEILERETQLGTCQA